MSSLVPITARTATIQGYELESEDDMFAALKYLSTLGYTGVINCQIRSGSPTWTIGLYNTQQNSSQTAFINDWIVLENGAIASVCPAANFDTLYSTSS